MKGCDLLIRRLYLCLEGSNGRACRGAGGGIAVIEHLAHIRCRLLDVFVLALHEVLRTFECLVSVGQGQHRVGVHELREVLVGLGPRELVFSDLGQLADLTLSKTCSQELPQRGCVLEVGREGLAISLKVLVCFIDGSAITCVSCDTVNRCCQLIHEVTRERFLHALVLVHHPCPQLHCGDLPRTLDPLEVLVVEGSRCQDVFDLIGLQDGQKLPAACRLLLGMGENGVM